MASKHEDKTTRIVTNTRTWLCCDICKTEAPRPEAYENPWIKDKGLPHWVVEFDLIERWPGDWTNEADGLDICYDCMEALIKAVREQPIVLAALIGRNLDETE